MTIIAYKDGIIASDSKATLNGMHFFNAKKIVKAKDGTVSGGAGSMTWVVEFNDWILSGRKRPWSNFIDNMAAIYIDPHGVIRLVSPGGIIEANLLNGCIAIGSGRDFAMGAMDAGVSAEEAVKIAIIRDNECGGPVQSERFEKVEQIESIWRWFTN